MDLIALQNEKAKIGDNATQQVEAYSRLGEIGVPFLTIIGDLDETGLQQAAAYMAAHIKNARSEIISGTAHVPNMEKPDAFNHILMTFLQDVVEA